MNAYIERVLAETKAKNANEPEFLQTVEEVLSSLEPVINAHPEYEKACLLERMVEPERTIEFRVVWMDDNLQYHVNRGYRVQYNAALGPYKGGLRFASNVNLSIIKFLGFEQTFKDALTCLPIGGAKGGSDFSPIGRSDGEVMRFCQAFMTEFHRHIGQDIDCPAGDVGVGGREVGYLYGQYRRIVGAAEFGAMSGKDIKTGGSILRPEATGFGALYFVNHMMKDKGLDIAGKTVAISGFGNVAWGAAKKATQLGAKVITISGPDGYIHDPEGVSGDKIEYMLELRSSGNDICQPYAEVYPEATFVAGKKPWEVKADIYLTCATQNELNGDDADMILANHPLCVAEVSNMGCTAEAVEKFVAAKQLFAPGKAVNAGGVATSGLEMTQNSIRLHWSKDEVDEKLHYIMSSIHDQCAKYGTEPDGYINYVKGANIAGFMKVAKAMLAQGVV